MESEVFSAPGDDAVEPATDGHPTLLYAVKQVELAVRAHMDALLRPINITALQYTALTVLRRRDGLSAAELARNSFVTAQTMGEMISTLEKRGLLTRRIDPANKRRMLTSLTDDARSLLADSDAEILALENRMLGDLSPQQRQAFRHYLSSCRVALGDTRAH